MQPIKLEIFLDDKTLAGMKSVAGNIAATEAFAKQMIDHLKVQLKELEAQYKVLQKQGLAGDKEMADIQAMQGAIGGLKEQLKELQKIKQQTNETSVIGDDPAPKLNSVKMSMAQIARELPSIAMGPQMFFLAISNNIPIFTDAISNAQKEYERLTAAGQKATPVWKQVLSSIFSWQTVMATAITLTVVYGKEIGNFFSSLFSGKKTITGLADAQEELNKTMMSSDTGVGKNLVSLKMLQEKWSSLGNDLAAKKKFIRENKDEFDKLNVAVTNVSDAENLLVGNTEAFIKSMQLRAKGAAAQKMAAEKYEESLKLQLEIEKEKKRPVSTLERVAGSINTVQSRGLVNETGEDLKRYGVEYLEKQKKAVDDAADAFFQLGVEAENEAQKELKAANIKEKIKVKTPAKGGKTITDYENELSDARVRAQQKIEATRIAVMADGYKKRQKLARQEMDEEIARIDKEERDTLKKMQDKKKKGGTVTPEQENQVKDTAKLQRMGATEIYIKDYLKIEQEGQRDSLQSWADYTKEYGTYQEKRLAIELEYNQKIADINELRRQAQADGDAEMVKQQDIALAKATKDKGKELISMDYTQLIQSPDYVRAFENLKETSTDTLGSLLEQFENAKQTAAQVLSPDQLREYTTTIQEIMDELDSRNPFQTLADRKKELAEAEEELAKAQQQLNAINKNDAKIETGVKSSKYNQSTGKIESEKQYLTSARALEKYNKAQDKVAKSGAKVEQAEKDVQDVVNELSNSFKELGEAIGGQAGEIISLIGDIGTFAMTAMNGVTTASTTASEAVKAVEKASVILAIIGAAIQIATKIASMFKDDDGVAEYERAKEVYESYIDILDRVIEKQKELFELNSKIGEQAYEKAKSMVKQQEDASRDLGKQYLDSGASKGVLGFGSSASEGTKQRKDISSKAWNEAKKVLGNDFYNKGIGDGRMTGLFDLSVEQLKKLQDDAPLFWAELKGDTQKYLQQIIDCNEELTKLENDRKEGLVKTDFDSFLSSFTDTLMDMDSSSKDFADNFEEYLKKAILSSLITEKYKGKIKQLYDDWATATGSGNELTEQETKALKERQEKLAEEMLKDRQGLADVFGWKGEEETSSQSGRPGAFETMTQEQGTKLEGLFTALQDHTSAIHKLLEDLMSGRDADKEIFMQIAENTAYCKFLEQMYEIMERQDRDGMKMRG